MCRKLVERVQNSWQRVMKCWRWRTFIASILNNNQTGVIPYLKIQNQWPKDKSESNTATRQFPVYPESERSRRLAGTTRSVAARFSMLLHLSRKQKYSILIRLTYSQHLTVLKYNFPFVCKQILLAIWRNQNNKSSNRVSLQINIICTNWQVHYANVWQSCRNILHIISRSKNKSLQKGEPHSVQTLLKRFHLDMQSVQSRMPYQSIIHTV